MDSKACKICQQTKPLTEYHNRTKSRDGKDHRCKQCRQNLYQGSSDYHREMAKSYQNRLTPEERKWNRIKVHYKLTESGYLKILEDQDSKCPICGKRLLLDKDTHVDHDHSCCPGVRSCGDCVRGLLCSGCNHLLGKAKDDVTVLRSAVQYLEKYERSGEING